MKRLPRLGARLTACVLSVLLVQALVFAILIRSSLPREQAGGRDLLVVFGGDDGRVREALLLESRFHYRYMIVSDSSPRQVEAYFRAYGRPRRARVLYEPLARTTDQNARYVSGLIRRHQIRSVLLVTSWFHVPRALLLLKGYLLGQGVRISAHASDSPSPRSWILRGHFRQELVKFWGSLWRAARAEIKVRIL